MSPPASAGARRYAPLASRAWFQTGINAASVNLASAAAATVTGRREPAILGARRHAAARPATTAMLDASCSERWSQSHGTRTKLLARAPAIAPAVLAASISPA